MKSTFLNKLIPNRIVYKILVTLLILVSFFSAVVFQSMYKNNAHFSQQFIDTQRELLERQVRKEQHELYEWEMEHIREHAQLVSSLIKKGFAIQASKDKFQKILRIFMTQKNIRIIHIYDGKENDVYLGMRKNDQGQVSLLTAPPVNTAELKRFNFPLTVNNNPLGGVAIYYSLNELKEKIEEELHEIETSNYALLEQQAQDIRDDMQSYFLNNFMLFMIFLLTMLAATAFIFTRYIHHPLQVLRDNLQQFFAFFQNPSMQFQPRKLAGQDEFSQMSNEIDAHIQSVVKLYQDVNTTQKEILVTIGSIAEKHSLETKNHVQRVAGYSEILGRYSGLSDAEIALLKDASTLHDLGKVAIPDTILKKPGPLTSEEFAIMQTHARHGYDMLRHSSRPLLKAAAIIAYEHHEKYDGSGYPRGLAGEAIHLYGRIVALADVFDALSSDRIYKKRWSDEEILDYLLSEKGRHFDPKLVDIFFEHYEEFIWVRKQYYDGDSPLHPDIMLFSKTPSSERSSSR